MCAKFRENQRKTAGVAIRTKFDDIHTDRQTDRQRHINHLYYKLRWLQASSGTKENILLFLRKEHNV